MPKAYASTVLNASAKEVWAAIRDFNSLPAWHPAVPDSTIEDGLTGQHVGAVRSFHLQDGAHLRERLLGYSDVDRHYSYNFEKTPFSVLNYHATLRVTPVTDGDRAFVEWWTTFDCEPEKIDDWIHTFAEVVFKGGLDALKARFGG
jgi:hypothetical protein